MTHLLLRYASRKYTSIGFTEGVQKFLSALSFALSLTNSQFAFNFPQSEGFS
jgi:hypothetical protein